MGTTTAAAPRAQNRGYVLSLLVLVYAFNFIDRQILSIVGPAVQADLGIGDAQFGYLTGAVFALFYSVLGVPVALLADRVNRVLVVAVSLAIWSGFTVLSGFASTFFLLALFRVGVAVGEAGGSPPSHSILSDLYAPKERGRALGIYSLGIPFGIMAAFFIGAYFARSGEMDWRATLIAVGAPGIVLAALLKLTVKEPPRGRIGGAPRTSLGDALGRLLPFKSYWLMAFGAAGASFSGYAVSAFLVIYLTRAFPEIALFDILVMLGLFNGIPYALGAFAGGAVADRFAQRSVASYGLVAALSLCVVTPVIVAAFWTQSFTMFLVLFGINIFFGGFYLGPSFSVAQNLAPVEVRATSTAIFFLVLNIIALGGGSTVIGIVSTALTEQYGAEQGLRLALTWLIVPYLVAIACYLGAARTLPGDWARAQGET